jgi:3-oxoacyl-[acyl-carrier-protein] synthase-3
MTGAYIAGVDYALPARRVTNAELTELHPEWQMSQVLHQTGVEYRYWCDAGETALDLAELACRRLLARLDIDPVHLAAVLFCTQSPDHIMPPNACLLQHRLRLPTSVAALDFSLACSGFVYGLYLARSLVQSGSARHVLLVTADTYSKWMHRDDRGPVTLFGDGAAATLISAGKEAIGECILGSDGGRGSCLMVPAGGARLPRSAETARLIEQEHGNVRSAEHFFMNGAAVLDFVKKEIPALVGTILERRALTLGDIDLVLFHQASKVTLDHLHNALHVPRSKQFCNLDRVGNLVSASIPVALRDAEVKGVLKPGMRILLVGFGVGLSWGGCVVEWCSD